MLKSKISSTKDSTPIAPSRGRQDAPGTVAVDARSASLRTDHTHGTRRHEGSRARTRCTATGHSAQRGIAVLCALGAVRGAVRFGGGGGGMRTVVCAAAVALLLCPPAAVGQDDVPDTAERLRGEAPGPAPRSRWGVDAPPAKKGKLMRAETAPLPDLGVMQAVPLMGGRRHFYGRGCAAVDVNGDGHEDIYLANGDNARAQELFGTADCSSRLYLSRDSSGEFEDVPVEPDDKYAQGTAVPLGIEPDATQAQWGQCFFDMDNDGDQDLVILPGGYEAPFQLRLYENVGAGAGDHGGYFRDATASAGLSGRGSGNFGGEPALRTTTTTVCSTWL